MIGGNRKLGIMAEVPPGRPVRVRVRPQLSTRFEPHELRIETPYGLVIHQILVGDTPVLQAPMGGVPAHLFSPMGGGPRFPRRDLEKDESIDIILQNVGGAPAILSGAIVGDMPELPQFQDTPRTDVETSWA